MITKKDCVLLLSELQEKGIDVSSQLRELMASKSIPLDVLKYINDHRELEVTAFYNMLRVNYNKKKSNLYINIVKEIDDPQEVLTTLSALSLQELLYAKKLDNPTLFLEHSRFKDIQKCLLNYAISYDITNCLNLMRLLKADCKALESLKNDRN